MQDKDKKTILVTGATGKQGGAVARHLANNGWRVRILVRDTNKPAAQAFAKMGVEVVQGNLDDRNSVLRAAKGVYGIFSVQSLEKGPEVEFRQGKTLADIGKECGTRHFVYNSVAAAERNTGIPFFESKWQIEQYIRSLVLPLTIFRPVWFMENLLVPQMRDSILDGTLTMPLRPEKTLQMIAVDSIGGFVAAAFEKPDQFFGRAIDIAGDELSMSLAAQRLSKVIERDVQFIEMPIAHIKGSNPALAAMFQWFNDYGFNCDIPKLRQMLPDLMDFETWLYRFGKQHFVREDAVIGAKDRT